MEYDLMSASFASISGKTFSDSETRGKFMSIEVTVEKAEPGCTATSTVDLAPDLIFATTAHDSFVSIVNASNCANAHGADMLEGYLTLTRQATFLRSYLH